MINIFKKNDDLAKEESLRKEQFNNAEQQKRINYGIIFSTAEGFEVLKDIMSFCHVNSISYSLGDQYETAFREGERNVFLYILSQLSDEMKSKIIIGG
jgi:hypothetical protein